MVAPVNVGKRSYTAAGAVITKDVPEDNLAIGVPAKNRKMEQIADKGSQKSKLGEKQLG